MTQSELLQKLETDLNEILKRVRTAFANLNSEALHASPGTGQWNALECFAHLNAQFEYYFPRIELAMHKAKARKWYPAPERHSNWLGHRAIRAVSGDQLRHSPKKINPSKLLPVRENELKVFLINAEMLLRLIRQANEINLNKARIKPQHWWQRLSNFKAGDLLEYLVLHTQRHILQAEKALGTPRT